MKVQIWSICIYKNLWYKSNFLRIFFLWFVWLIQNNKFNGRYEGGNYFILKALKQETPDWLIVVQSSVNKSCVLISISNIIEIMCDVVSDLIHVMSVWCHVTSYAMYELMSECTMLLIIKGGQ